MKLRILLLFVLAVFAVNRTQACTANTSYTVDTTTNPHKYYFSSSGSSGFGGLSYSWTFGDATGSTQANPMHQYATSGTYNVCLTVTDSTFCTNTKCFTIVYVKPPCKANVTFTLDTTVSPPRYRFFSAGSQGLHLSYTWTFGDATGSTLANPFKQYSASGTYNVCLTVRDSTDTTCVNTKCISVTYVKPPCKAVFTYSIDTTTNPSKYFFNPAGSTGAHLRYTWDFGDSTILHQSGTVMHQFTKPGTYVVCLTVRDSTDTTCINTKCIGIFVPSKVSCSALFSYTIDTTTIPITYKFNGSASTGASLTYQWNFGDATTGSGVSPTHQYTKSGTYLVCLTVVSSIDTSCKSTKCLNITYIKPPCTARITYTIDTTVTPKKFNFSGSTSSGSHLQYTWTFGDSTSSGLMNPLHQYSTPGAYTVCLTVRDSTDTTCVSTRCITVIVSGPPCTANFNFTIDTTTNPRTYHFSSAGSTGSSLTYAWTFGDGGTSTAANPTHQYSTPGNKTICLTVTSSFDPSCKHTKCITINVPVIVTCTANFSYFDSITYPGLIYFVNTSTGNNLIYSWTFGDGGNSTAKNPTHQYTNGGTYTVCLTVTSSTDTSCHSTKCISITIPSSPCTAEFGYFNDTITPNGTLHFFPTYGKSNTTYYWNFGDGDTSTQQYPVHHYSTAGVYYVCLTISHPSDSCYDTWCDSVIVHGNTGIGKMQNGHRVLVYPNPFSNRLHVEMHADGETPAEVIITDMLGRTHLYKTVELRGGKNDLELDVTNLARGLYFIELKTNNSSSINRIVK